MKFEYLFLFGLLALMRVVQSICSKRVSDTVSGTRFFHYGGYYNLMSALLSLIVLFFSGYEYFKNWQTLLCAFATAVFMALELFVYIKVLKKTTLLVAQMFSVCSLIIPCLVGELLFNEPMNAFSWFGVLLFIFSLYFMIAPSKEQNNQEQNGKFSLTTLILLLIYCFVGGAVMVTQKVFALKVENGNVSEYSFLMFAFNAIVFYVIYLILWLSNKNTEKIGFQNTTKLSKALFIYGAVLAVVIFTINLSVTTLAKDISSAILFSISYAISIFMTMLVGVICYKEKITLKNVIGIILAVLAIIVINFLG